MISCKKCGQELPDEAVFCFKCGNKTEKKKLCPKCGKELPKESEFCMFCGEALNISAGVEQTIRDEKSSEDNSDDFVLEQGKRVEDKMIRVAVDSPKFREVLDHIMKREFGKTLKQYNFYRILKHNMFCFGFVFIKGQYDFVDRKLDENHAEAWEFGITGISFEICPTVMAYCNKDGKSLKVQYNFDFVTVLTKESCDKWGISYSWDRSTFYSHCRRRGFGSFDEDERFPEMSVNEVQKEMLKNTKLFATIGTDRYELTGIGEIGPYALKEGMIGCMFFEKDDKIICRFYHNSDTFLVASLSGLEQYAGVQSLRVEGDKLNISYYVSVRQTGWQKEYSTMGDMGSEFMDEYQADTREIYIDISDEAEKKWIRLNM